MSVHEAAEEGNEEELLRLIQKDITSVNEDDEYGETPLHLACSAGHANCVKLLLNNGAEVDSQNSNGVTPLHQSARLGRVACVSLLLRKGLLAFTMFFFSFCSLYLPPPPNHHLISDL